MTVLEVPADQTGQLELEARYLAMKISQRVNQLGHLGSAVVLRAEVDAPDQFGNRGVFLTATERWTQEDVDLSPVGNPIRKGAVWLNLNGGKEVDIDWEAKKIVKALNHRKAA